jgi:hypothetical protein
VDKVTLIVAALILVVVLLCMTALALAKITTGDPVVHLGGVIVGGILGFLSPSISNRTTTTPLGTVSTEKVG